MEQKTDEHLQAARRNRDFARALLGPSVAHLSPAPWEWVVVIAFYSAVHYVNAYLWETARIDPSSHGERQARLRREPAIRHCRRRYARLQELGQLARYEPTFTVSEQDARNLVDGNLRDVEAAVMAALNLPAPIW